VLLQTKSAPRWRRAATWFALGGLIAIGASATALPIWAYALMLCPLAVGRCARFFGRRSTWATAAGVATLVALALIEAPHHVLPALRPSPTRQVAIIGDSITAGYGADDAATKWPAILRDRHGVDVEDLSRIGATAASAATRLRENPVDAAIVLVEIGGNDMLGKTTPAAFEAALDTLLAALRRPGRQIVMFELPLPPLHERFGRIQRQLAARHGISLIPKRVLLSVIEGSDATVDSLHLTQRGHDRMAAFVWAILAPAMPTPISPPVSSPT
jgi:acyl-CoA thioesterase-1